MGDPLDVRKAGSVPENKSGFTVDASPLNPVKIDLGLILIVGFLLLVLATNLVASQTEQFGYLVGYGFVGMCWIIYRVRKIMAQITEKTD